MARLPHEQGFTLVELLVGMVVAVIVLIGGTLGLADAFKQNTSITNRVTNTSNAEVGLQRLTDDLREAVPCPTGLTDGTGNSLTGGLYVKAGPVIEMCDPTPGAHSTDPPPEDLVVWTCSNATAVYGTTGGTAESCGRTYAPVTVTSATTASAGAAVNSITIDGVKSLTLTGLTGSGSAATAAPLTAPALYSLATAGGLSFVGIQGKFYNLSDPANPADATNNYIASTTSVISLSTGASLRNYDT